MYKTAKAALKQLLSALEAAEQVLNEYQQKL